MKVFLLTLCTLIFFSYSWGQSSMPSDAIDLTSGSLYLKSTGYAVGATGNAVTTHTGNYNIYTSSTTDKIIKAETGPQTINLWNVNYATTSGYFITNSLANNLTVNCYGDNYLTNTIDASQPFIYFAKKGTTTLTIAGDKLTTSNKGGVFLISLNSTTIVMNIKYLNVTCTNSSIDYVFGLNANNNFSPSFTINDDAVFTINNAYMPKATSLIIGKASIKFVGGSFLTKPTNSNNDTLYCVTVPRNGTHTITVKNNTTSTSEDYTFTYEHPNDDNYYLWLPNGSYTLTSNGTDYNAEVNSAAVTASVAPKAGDGNIDVSAGNVSIYDGGYQIGIQPYIYTDKVYTLSGSTTTNTVSITAGADTVKLNGVDLEPAAGCAININTGTNIVVVLNQGTTNTLKSYTGAGLQKSQTDGMLTIKGKGTLIASASAGPGIGSASSACSNITIEEGTINVRASTSSIAAIGTGNYNSSNIYIKGGDITASVINYAYAIGGNSFSSVSNLVISGGRINLTSGGRHENTYLLPNCTITGGTVNGKVIGSGALMSSVAGGSIIIGGSVNLVDTACLIVSNGHPTNGTTTDYLYRSQFLIPGITSATAVGSITVDGNAWGCKDVFTNDTGMVYLWLPKDDASTYETTKVIITVGDKTYNYSGQIDALDNIVAATASVAAQGNYFYQVPVSITTSHASVTVADAEGNSISDGSLIGSGILDDNKPRLAVTATADEGYNAPVVSVTNLDKGSKYYKVTAIENQTVSIDASADIQTFPVTFQSVHGAVAVVASDTSVLSDEWLNYGTSISISTTPDEHYQFDSLLVNGVKVTDGAATITSATTITAYFSLMKFSVSIVGENGSIVVLAGETSIHSGDKVDYGTELSISAIPTTGYQFDYVMVNGIKQSETTYTVTGEVEVAAAFSLQSFTLTYATQNGTISVTSEGDSLSSGASISYGSELTIEATPANGYQLDTLKVNDIKVTSGSALKVTSDVKVSAMFSKIATGTITLSSKSVHVYAGSMAVVVEAAEGATAEVYSLAGQKVASVTLASSLQFIPVAQGGVYLVKVITSNGTEIVKCLVK